MENKGFEILTVNLRTIDKVKDFCTAACKFDCDIDVASGRYIIDAKSIMGLFSLDLSRPLTIKVHAIDDNQLTCVKNAFADFIV